MVSTENASHRPHRLHTRLTPALILLVSALPLYGNEQSDRRDSHSTAGAVERHFPSLDHPKLLGAESIAEQLHTNVDSNFSSARVILSLVLHSTVQDVADSDERLDASALDQLRDLAAEQVAQALADLDIEGFDPIQPFRYQPAIVARVTATALAALVEHPLVARIEPDRRLDGLPPALADDGHQAALEIADPSVLYASDVILSWEAAIDRLSDPDEDPQLAVVTEGIGREAFATTCDTAFPTLAQAARLARAAGLTLLAPSGDLGDCGRIAWPACLSDVLAVGAVYAEDAGILGWCLDTATCTDLVPESDCATGQATWEYGLREQVPVYSNSGPLLDLLAPSPALGGGTLSAAAAAAIAANRLQATAWAEQGRHLSPSELTDLLITTGIPLADTKNGMMRPLIDPDLALQMLAAPDSDAAAPPVVQLESPAYVATATALSRQFDAAGSDSPEITSVTRTAATPMAGCVHADHLALTGERINGQENFIACRTLAATDFVIGRSADVSFRAGERITLGPGFVVERGAQFDAVIETVAVKLLPLNDTGLNFCANATSNGLNCPVDGYSGQDAEFGRDALAAAGRLQKIGAGHAGFDFTKLDANGRDLPASAGTWSCVRDNQTGLIWEKTARSSISETCYWYNPDQNTNGGDAGRQAGEGSYAASCDTYKLVQEINAQNLCGASDWRLPTVVELVSIINLNSSGSDGHVDPDFFPVRTGYDYWSSDSSAEDPSQAWIVDFGDARVYRRSKGHSIGSARLVRGGR